MLIRTSVYNALANHVRSALVGHAPYRSTDHYHQIVTRQHV